jgi:hypothetical protein
MECGRVSEHVKPKIIFIPTPRRPYHREDDGIAEENATIYGQYEDKQGNAGILGNTQAMSHTT